MKISSENPHFDQEQDLYPEGLEYSAGRWRAHLVMLTMEGEGGWRDTKAKARRDRDRMVSDIMPFQLWAVAMGKV